MNSEKIKLFFRIIYCGITGKVLTKAEKELFNIDLLKQFMALAQKHDVLNLLAIGLKNNDLLGASQEKLNNEIFKAVYRCENQNYELEKISDVFKEAQIPFIPLKGSVVRKLYPEPWMRTSCDIDILIHKEDIDRASRLLENSCEYQFGGETSHDVSFYKGNNLHIELHYDLIEDAISSDAISVLNNMWDMVEVDKNALFLYNMTDEAFYFYHIAHMAKHFVHGGCGIRPFIDLWILNHRCSFDRNKRYQLLEKGGLLTFAKQVEKLSEVWLENCEYNDVTEKLENYVIKGGVYGSTENRIVVQQHKKGGKFKYALSRIFLPYDIIKFHFPILQKNRWLTPIMEVCRWFRLIFGGKLKSSLHELNYNRNISQAEAKETKIFIKNIGL